MAMAPPRDANMANLMKRECLKWHPDKVGRWPGVARLTDVDLIMVGMVCRVMTDAVNKYSGR